MALANVPTSSGTYTYSGIKMKYTMTINSVTKSGNNTDINYTLKSERVSGSSHPYASIQAKLNGTQVYNSGYNSYSSWPGAEGSKSFTNTADNSWGSNITFQVTGHIGSSSGNTLSGNTATIQWNTLSYSSAQGTVPATTGQYTGNSVTVGSLTNLSNAYQFNYWSGSDGKTYYPGNTITFNNASITLTANLTLLKPTMNTPSFTGKTDVSLTYSSLSANITSGCTFEYKIGSNGGWTAANANGGDISGLRPNQTYTIYFRACYAGNYSDNDVHISGTTENLPAISSVSYTSRTAGQSQRVQLSNPCGRSVSVKVYVENSFVKNSGSTTGTYIDVALSNAEAGPKIGPSATQGTVKYELTYTVGQDTRTTTNSDQTIVLTGSGPTVTAANVNDFITVTQTDSAAIPSGSNGTIDTDHLIRGKSVVTITLNSNKNPFTALYGANLDTYEIFINDSSKGAITVGTAKTISGTVPNATSYKINIVAKDTRGYTSTASSCQKSLTTTAYSSPSITLLNVSRIGGYSTNAQFSSQGSVSSAITGITSGAAYFKLYCTPTPTGGASPIDLNITNGLNRSAQQITGTFSISSSYSIYLEVKDKYGGTAAVSSTLILPKGQPTVFIDVEQDGLGVNCFPNGTGLWIRSEGVASVSAQTTTTLTQTIFKAVYPIGSIYMTIVDVNPGNLFGGTWSKIEGKFLIGASSTYAVNTNGGSSTITSVPPHVHTMNFSSGGSTPGTNSVANHTHSVNSHTHTYSGSVTVTGGNHRHKYGWGSPYRAADGSKWWTAGNSTTGGGKDTWTDYSGDLSLSGSFSGNTGGSTPGTTEAGGHSHTVNNHTHTVNGSTDSSGTNISSGGVSIIPPYYAVYIWKRTA